MAFISKRCFNHSPCCNYVADQNQHCTDRVHLHVCTKQQHKESISQENNQAINQALFVKCSSDSHDRLQFEQV